MSKLQMIESYVFELAERITRFYIHLEQVRLQYYPDNKIDIKDSSIFIKGYKNSLMKMAEMACEISKIDETKINDHSCEEIMASIRQIQWTIADLHVKWLGNLPRPSEPRELKRFRRIIKSQVIKLGLNNQLSDRKIFIFITEEISEIVYAEDFIKEFNATAMNIRVAAFNLIIKPLTNTNITPLGIDTEYDSKHNIFITIPRMDMNNPCRWPTLIHEVAHSIYGDLYANDTILKNFNSSLEENQALFVNSLEVKFNLEAWLIECWCDIFACLSMGPAFWFSQYSTFIFNESLSIKNQTHPPALFRLKLIRSILSHRFPNMFTPIFDAEISNCIKIVAFFNNQHDNSLDSYEELNVRNFFKEYYLKYFLREDTELNEKLKSVFQHSDQIKKEVIEQLVEQLKMGLPIPSKKVSDNPNYKEEFSSIQEIILSAWLYRNSEFKKTILDDLRLLNDPFDEKYQSAISRFEATILKKFQKFDDCILRSIQVSEWVDLYTDEETDDSNKNKFVNLEGSFHSDNLLIDNEINSYIHNGDIKIIPIIDYSRQVSSTSFDIRLGTSFQLFLPNQSGIVDFYKEGDAELIDQSKMIDLDFMEPIIISPGQFVLGHSMEYFRFPKTIACELDGRSSFARLGLEIHMTAGFIDPGYEGVITFEMFNAGPNAIKLFPGVRIGQLRFIQINKPQYSYKDKHQAKYNNFFAHNTSLQFKDIEVEKVKKKIEKEERKRKELEEESDKKRKEN